MDECLQILDERQECLNDETLVQQVRLQLVVEKVTLGTWDEERISAPLSFYLQALHAQLQEVKVKLPPQLQYNGKLPSINYFVVSSNALIEVVLAHLYSSELTINEIALSQMPINTKHSSFKQLKILHACVESIKSWFEVFFTIPHNDYVGFPFSIFSQLVHCLVILYRLSTLDDPAWDKNGVQETADLLLIVDQLINKLDYAAAKLVIDDSPEADVFSRTAKKLRSIRLEWEAKLRPDDLTVSTIPNPQIANETPFPEDFPMDFPDNDWMMDFLLTSNL